MKDILSDSQTFNSIRQNFNKSTSLTFNMTYLTNAGLTFYYGLTPLSHLMMDQFQLIIQERSIQKKIALILDKDKWNKTENKSVLHHYCRHPNPPDWISKEQKKWIQFYYQTQGQFTDIVQIGLGGSELGPKTLIHALQNEYRQHATPHFISSVDEFEIYNILKGIDLKRTLFIIASKSGTTIETLYIWDKVKAYCLKRTQFSEQLLKQNSIVITCPDTPLDNIKAFRTCFYTYPEIGGRFSITSAVGGVITSLIYGPDCFNEFLRGVYALDPDNIETDIHNNIALINACLTIIYRNLYYYSATAIIPYSNALKYFPDYLQQLICESNGKSVDLSGNKLPYDTSPAIMMGIGTNAQHSIFQQFYEGSQTIPVTFIGIKNNDFLNRHLVANATALFKQNRPSTILMLRDLSAYSIGNLISFYENMVLYEGLLWGINSFDQPGIELSKRLLKYPDEIVDKLYMQISR